MVGEICIEGFDLDKSIMLSTGSTLFNCKPVTRNCTPNIIVLDDRIVLKHGGMEVSICSGLDCVVSLNNPKDQLYIHYLILDNDIVEGYITSQPINPYLFTGAFDCLLSSGLDLRTGFSKTMDVLSIGGGNPFNYFRIIVSEHYCFNRLIDSVERLVGNRELLDKIDSGIIVIGCRCLGNSIYQTKIYLDGQNPIIGFVNRLNVEIYSEYKVFDEESSYICLENIPIDIVEKYGYIVKNMDRLKCVLEKDPVKLVVLLEKIYR